MVDWLGLKECLLALSIEEREHNILPTPSIGLIYLVPEAHLPYVFEPSLLHVFMQVLVFVLRGWIRLGVVSFFRRSNFFGGGVVSNTVALLRPVHSVNQGHTLRVHDEIQKVSTLACTKVHPLAALVAVKIDRHTPALLSLNRPNLVATRLNPTVGIQFVANACGVRC